MEKEEEKEKKKSGFATASLVLGIIGLCTSFIPIVNNLSFILALIGILFAIVSLIKKASKKMAIAGIIICILTCYFTVKSQEATVNSINDAFGEVESSLNDATGDNTDEIAEKYCDVSFGTIEVTTSYGFTEAKLPVTITNIGSESKSFSIQIEALDENGTRIETDTIYVSNLSAGQSAAENAFTIISSDTAKQLKTATFNVVSISMY